MKKIITLLGAVALSAVLALPLQANERKLLYRSFNKEAEPHIQVDETDIVFKETKEGAVIIRTKQATSCLIRDEFVVDKDHSLLRWSRSCPEEGTDFVAEKQGDALMIKGEFLGKPVEKALALENKYLHIYPNYTLGRFAFSGAKTMKLWSIRRDELELLPMQARVEGEETITIDGKKINVVKVYYSIVGKMREKFYNHRYYYRKSDGVYLKKIQQDGEIEVLVKEK